MTVTVTVSVTVTVTVRIVIIIVTWHCHAVLTCTWELTSSSVVYLLPRFPPLLTLALLEKKPPGATGSIIVGISVYVAMRSWTCQEVASVRHEARNSFVPFLTILCARSLYKAWLTVPSHKQLPWCKSYGVSFSRTRQMDMLVADLTNRVRYFGIPISAVPLRSPT